MIRFLLSFLTLATFAQIRMIPHVTRTGGGFQTIVILENMSDTAETAVLDGYQQDGSHHSEITRVIPAHTVLSLEMTDLFGEGADISHIKFGPETASFLARVAYKVTNGPGSPAHVGETSLTSQNWRFLPGDWEQVFDGIAVVNVGSSATDVWVTQRNYQGSNLKSIEVFHALAPMGKGLKVIGAPSGSDFISGGESYFEVSATQDLVFLGLRGTPPGSPIGFLWENMGTPFTPDGSRNDSSRLVLEASNGHSLQNPAFSPDRMQVLYTQFHNGYNQGPSGMFLVGVDGGEPLTLLDNLTHDHVNLPGTSWNGFTQLITFSSDRIERDEIWTIKPDGSSLNQVTRSSSGVALESSFSPDGEWICFEWKEHPEQPDARGSIWKVRLDGTQAQALTDTSANTLDDRQPNWSPLGDQILFQRRESGSEWGLYTMDSDGDEITRITPNSMFSYTDGSWSPDGQWVVCSSDEGNLAQPCIFLIDTQEEVLLQVTFDERHVDGAPSWSPDGRKILFESFLYDEGELPASLWEVDVPWLDLQVAPSNNDTMQKAMRDFVKAISHKARQVKPGFLIVPQNGLELLTLDGDDYGFPDPVYFSYLDGIAQEHVYYGQDGYDTATPAEDATYLENFLKLSEKFGIQALVADYCSSPVNVDDCFSRSAANGFISFAGDGGYDLDNIPPYPVYNQHQEDVPTLAQAKNFLYLITPTSYGTKQAFLQALEGTDYDLLIIDLFFGTEPLSLSDINRLKTKAHGGTRLVIAYMNIGAAENWRYYWQSGWSLGNPDWLIKLYDGYPDEFWVRYWDPAWQTIIIGEGDSYLKRVLSAGFDGVYLDNILAYQFL